MSARFTRLRKSAIALIAFALVFTAFGAFANDAFAQAAPPAAPKQLPQRGANYVWDKTILRAGFSYRDVLDRPMIEKLGSGLPVTIAMRAYVFKDGSDDPVALSVRTCRVVYDLWDEVYRIRLSSPGGERESAAVNVEGVMRQCAEARDQPIVDKSLLAAHSPYFLAMIVEVNPVSQQMLQQMRTWVMRPAGASQLSSGDALFGSFVGLFVRQIGNADRVLRFRTPTFTSP